MATGPLDRIPFMVKETKNPAVGSSYDLIGFFTCRRNVANFLEILDRSTAPPEGFRETADYTRTSQMVGNVSLGGSGADGAIEVAGSRRAVSSGGRGSRTVILKTGAKIGTSNRYHSVSFRFPGWVSVVGISDALAELIPEGKRDGGATGVRNSFTVKGGRTYPIMATAAATARTATDVAITEAEATTIAEAQRRKEKPPTT